MKNIKKKKLNKTEESIFTLLSLFVLINQAFESLTNKEDILHSTFDKANHTFKDLVNDTIHEALVYQILLKSCAFLDEWNKIFGVQTNAADRDKILQVKRVAKPAYKRITEWKNLRDFRNEAIAHNHRNKKGENIYLNFSPYHSPQTNAEIYLLVYCLKKMIDIVDFFFKDVVYDIVINKLNKHSVKSKRAMGTRKIKQAIRELDTVISSELSRLFILSAVTNQNQSDSITLLA